jgi:hypothetical protein
VRTVTARRLATTVALAALAAMTAFGCGGAGKKGTADEAGADEAAPEREPEAIVEDGIAAAQMEGLLGTIPQHEVESVFQRKQEKILDCFVDAYEILEEIEGSVELSFEVAADGSARDVYFSAGDLGSRVAQECILAAVGRFTFPRPRGGSHAVVTYPMTFEEPYNHPPPLDWSGPRASDVIGAHMDDLERCLGGETGFTLTLYVAAGGKVVSAGATAASFATVERARCLEDAAMSWVFPDPGDRPAKAVAEL